MKDEKMSLKERIFIDKCEVLLNGVIQVRNKCEIYDTKITPISAVPEVRDDDGFVIEPAIAAITDVKSTTYHRYIIQKDDKTPLEVQLFIDNTKAV